jgi:hypothetical protein
MGPRRQASGLTDAEATLCVAVFLRDAVGGAAGKNEGTPGGPPPADKCRGLTAGGIFMPYRDIGNPLRAGPPLVGLATKTRGQGRGE